MTRRADFSDDEILTVLANTGHGTQEDPHAPDELRTAASARAWWASVSGSPASGVAGDVELLLAARTVIRDLGLRNNGVDVAVGAGALAGLSLRLELDAGPTLVVAGASTDLRDLAGWAVLALIRWSATPTAPRLKACPGPGCGWVFRDTTRNGSRRWCAMAGCGNRAKAAAFRARAR